MSAPETKKGTENATPERAAKALLIADFDGTITDMIGPLQTLTENVYEEICALRKRYHLRGRMSWTDFMGEIKNERMPAEYRFHDFERLMYRLRRQSEFLQPRADTEEFRQACDQIVKNYCARREELLRPFEGAVSTLCAVKDQGAGVAIWSDAPAVSIFERMWIMRFPLDLIDAVYVPLRGNEHSDEPLMTAFGGEETAYKKRLMRLFHYLPERQFKPTATHVERICADFGVNAKDAVIIGDSLEKDGKSAFLANADFVFYGPGAQSVREHANFYRQIQVSHDRQELPKPASAKGVASPSAQDKTARGKPRECVNAEDIREEIRVESPYRKAECWSDLLTFFTFGLQEPSAHAPTHDLEPLARAKPPVGAQTGSGVSAANPGPR